MNSRIVQPAASFQPPDTCVEHPECQAAHASNADLSRAAQAHYDKISSAAHEWHSAIPKAIVAYYADPERARLEREVVEMAKAWRAESVVEVILDYEHALIEAVDALLTFEAEQVKKIG